ncbi:proline-rich protein 36-like [Macrobrachium nipponense]|uniref:proline-rich protein 36-like n=1 Tax=Macrobrachium nipponense TaxID=159736 RepID=UPI0030C7B004
MVTQLVVEDEYTINVKLRRPLTNGSCLLPPTITITPDDPTITILPPPNVSLTHAQAAKSVNGAPAMVVGCSTDLSKPFPLEGPSWCHYKADDYSEDLKARQLSIMPPPPSTPASPPPPPVRRTYLEERVSDDKVTHGCLRLPLVQVFSDDNMLVATNKFSTPSEPPPSSSVRLQPATSSFKSNSASSHALAPPSQLQEPPHPTAPGSLYVERIPAHCKSDCGVLYVPPVDERRLRRSKQDEPPAKGNSRRSRARSDGVASPSPPPPPPPPPPPATSVTWTPPERVPPRSSSSKAAARALLAEVLSPRIENQLQHRPPSPRPQRHAANHGIYGHPNFEKSNRYSS